MTNPISHIILELARERGHPLGDRNHAYHLYVPLDGEGRIDAAGWRKDRALCRVRRFRPGEAEVRGQVLHGPGGRWTFDYSDTSVRDDEAGFRFGDERFVPGEYVSIKEDDGQMHTFQVVSVKPL